jgi:hypothetical protein
MAGATEGLKQLTQSELKLDPEHYDLVNRWLKRGDGIAVYENVDLGSLNAGHRQFVSFGGWAAQLSVPEPPQRLPDIGNAVNWRYRLVGVYKGPELSTRMCGGCGYINCTCELGLIDHEGYGSGPL